MTGNAFVLGQRRRHEVGRVTPLRVQHAAIDLANAANPDLAVITGDFVCHSTKYLDELTSLIARIKAPVHGFYGGDDARVNATIDVTMRYAHLSPDVKRDLEKDGDDA